MKGLFRQKQSAGSPSVSLVGICSPTTDSSNMSANIQESVLDRVAREQRENASTERAGARVDTGRPRDPGRLPSSRSNRL
jgi:hypothetical protein